MKLIVDSVPLKAVLLVDYSFTIENFLVPYRKLLIEKAVNNPFFKSMKHNWEAEFSTKMEMIAYGNL